MFNTQDEESISILMKFGKSCNVCVLTHYILLTFCQIVVRVTCLISMEMMPETFPWIAYVMDKWGLGAPSWIKTAST
mgnify:CR=1 FL=1